MSSCPSGGAGDEQRQIEAAADLYEVMELLEEEENECDEATPDRMGTEGDTVTHETSEREGDTVTPISSNAHDDDDDRDDDEAPDRTSSMSATVIADDQDERDNVPAERLSCVSLGCEKEHSTALFEASVDSVQHGLSTSVPPLMTIATDLPRGTRH